LNLYDFTLANDTGSEYNEVSERARAVEQLIIVIHTIVLRVKV